MITCIAIDDEPSALDVISIHSSKVSDLNLVKCFTDPEKALEFLKDNTVDLAFLDINMPGLSGLELLKRLHSPPVIVFSTAYSEYALDSYDYDAVDYLLKPIEFNRFYKSIQKVKKLLSATRPDINLKGDFFFIKDGYSQVKIVFDEIVYVKSQGNYLDIYTSSKKVMARMTFSSLIEELPQNLLFRVHNSYMVNINFVDKIEDNHVFCERTKIPIGTTYKDNLYQKVVN